MSGCWPVLHGGFVSIADKVHETSDNEASAVNRSRFDYPLSSSILSGLSVTLEILTILIVGFATFYFLIGWGAHVQEYYASAICFLAMAVFLLAHFAGLYKFSTIIRPFEHLDKIIVVFATAFLLLLAVAFSLKVSEVFSRIWMYTFAMSACAASIAVRFAGSFTVHRLARSGVIVRNVAILGGGEQGARFLSHIAESRLEFVNVVGVFDDRLKRVGPVVEGYRLLGNLDDLVTFARKHRVDDVVIALPWSADQRLVSIVNRLRELPLNIHLSSDLAGFSLNYREAPSHFAQMPIVEVMETPLSGWNVLWKSIEDRVLALITVIVFFPVMVAVAIAIKIEDPGPVFFRQKRFGFNNKAFYIYKFRSMYYNRPPESTTVQAVRDDPRITKVGRFIRRTSLDEFPQLFNVLNGTMSLVGPRPHAVDHNEEYSKKIGGYFARHRVKPGMTGWAQVNGWRGETETLDKMEARVRHDIYYAENWSILFDLKILAMTVYVILLGKNAH